MPEATISGRTATEISNSLMAAIRHGSLRNGDPLPTVRALADKLRVNRNTVAAAYKQLAGAGLVETQGRRGSHVAGNAKPPRESMPVNRCNLAGGNPDHSLLPDLKSTLPRIQWRQRSYEDASDNPELVRYAEEQFKKDGIAVADLWLSNGAFDAMARVLGATLKPGEPVAVEDPCFMTTLGLLRELGHEPIPMAVDDEGVLPEQLERALSRGARGVILTPRAQNPFGSSWSAPRHATLDQILRRWLDVVLVEDDHFAPLSHAPVRSLVREERPTWAVVRSVSKYLGPDMRMAFVNSDTALRRKVASLNAFSNRWVSGILQALVLAAVTSSTFDQTVRRAASAYRDRRELFLRVLAEAGIKGFGADGMNVWIPVDDEQFVTRRLLEFGWLVRPGSMFRVDAPEAIRVTTSTMAEGTARSFVDLLAGLRDEVRVERGA